jgi:ferredoxin
MNGEEMHYDPQKCYGCGLCVSVCPEEATVMRQHQQGLRDREFRGHVTYSSSRNS